ncbi:MAG: diguanylate cyclase [Oscillospiraceae bacterium]|nr:diguanylate cyclase [Oscillospiraceae bacterium]
MKESKRRMSIKNKMFLFVIISMIAISFGTAMIAYSISVNSIDSYYKNMTLDIARSFTEFVDADYLAELRQEAESEEFQALRDEAEETDNESLIEERLKEKGLWDGYVDTRTNIMKYLNNINDVEYLYVVVWGGIDDTVDMYLVDDESIPLYETGYYEEREESLLGVDASKEVPPTISNGDWGWLCSAFVPVYNSKGELICQIGCDISMEDVMKDRHRFLIYILAATLVLTAAVLVCSVIFANRVVVKPLNALTNELAKFRPEKDTDYKNAGVIDIDIKSRDEIEDIYIAIRSMQKNIIDHLNDLSEMEKDKEKAEIEIKTKEEQIGQISREAYHDALTSVGSKTAYVKKIDEINAKLRDNSIEFAIVMVDMNDLKHINDSYGHKAGDQYIKGCCHLICDTFKHSPVYRIGGDEFVAILMGHDYSERIRLVNELKDAYDKAYSNETVDPWLRYSAAVGMAENASDDNTAELVFKRADKAMYKAKKDFKEEHGSTR